MSNGGSYAFQPFNSPLQMLVTNMPILTLDSIFPNGEGLKNVEKLILKRKFSFFKTPKRRMWHHSHPK
jgi:hypothetical protein